ncbi:MAG: hypothetical protein JO154_20580 [Chitinophaga sp.]|uniref:hypothetical protein n=1 Tax=Chitinophaga sp. TaxID=1869181 RepID=UPI0025BDDB98|nr:hypothetical protein [Chitinophaga sp.]MBV8255009.1 hypothetical protein [Chitinophaga sp.]
MARTIEQIQSLIVDKVNNTPDLKLLNSVSKTSIFRLFIYVVAFCQWTLDQLFDLHKQEVSDLISKMKPHSLKWYAEKAKRFQYGFNLPAESDTYDNTGIPNDQVEASKIVHFCAIVEQPDSRGVVSLRVKAATKKDDLDTLDKDQLIAFTKYMNTVKDAGVRLIVSSDRADDLRMKIDVYYNPLVLGSNGSRLDGTDSDPVRTAIREYLMSLPFNGSLVLAYLTDALQKVDGVVIPQIIRAEARYGNLPYKSIDLMYQPDAGYVRIWSEKDDLDINFIPQTSLI